MRLADLTPREREVAQLVARGLTYRQIAALLPSRQRPRDGITRASVQKHVQRIAAKLGRDETPPYRQIMRWVIEQEAA